MTDIIEVTMNRGRRRQCIRDLLIERRKVGGGATVAELADRYNVSPRTIQLDLQELGGEPGYVAIVLDITYEWRVI